MKKASHLLHIISIALFIASAAKAQDPNNTIGKVSIASPTAASLGKYGDIPVNYHTGIPQIGIPLYTVEAGPLSLSIGLSYHASGLKVQEPAGWVGAGWALNAGGVITRSVMGGPDEKGTNNGRTETHGHFSDYGYNSYLYDSHGQDWRAFATGTKDGEPDLYFFNFGGYSGKFYFNDDRTPIIVPEQDIKIVPDYDGTGTTGIQGFTLTTPDGVLYSFGKTNNIGNVPPVEVTSPITGRGGQSSATAISSWFLNKVSSSDNQFDITLKYEKEDYGFFTLSMFPLNGVSDPINNYEYDLVKNVVSGVRLSQIIFPNGTVSFVAGAVRTDLSDKVPNLSDNVNGEARSLASVQVSSASGFCKKYDFSYSYFNGKNTSLSGYLPYMASGALTTDLQRLKLEKVQETSCDGIATIPANVFTYFGEQLPRRLSFGIDHWGFYNGHDENQTLIPSYDVVSTSTPQNITGANRDASWPIMRGALLQQITYPTGGYTNFDFASNYVPTTHINYQLGAIVSLWAGKQYGQGFSATQTLPFTVTGMGTQACTVSVTNGSTNWSPSISVSDANGVLVYGPYQINTATTDARGNISPFNNNNNLPLQAGSYVATLSFPQSSSSSINGGANASVSQWKYIQYNIKSVVGGVRINSIVKNDGLETKNNIVTNYSYDLPVLYSRPTYVGIMRNDLIKNTGYWTVADGFVPSSVPWVVNGCTSGPSATYFKSPSSIQPMATTQGYPIGYSHVEVSQTGNGKSTYDYYGSPTYQKMNDNVAITSVNIDGCDANAPNYPPAPLPFEYMRGELSHEAHYDNMGKLLKEASYTPTYVNSTIKTPAFIVRQDDIRFLGTVYSINSAHKTQEVTVETDYSQATGSLVTTTTTSYGSSFHHQATQKVVTAPMGNITSNIRYAKDFRIAACDAIADGYPAYTNSCANCLTTYNTRVGCGNDAQCLTNAFLAYQQCLTTARTNYVQYQKTNFTNTTNTFQTAHNTAKSGADAELKPILELQDEYRNPVLETSQWRDGNLLAANFTRYGFMASPSGIPYPSRSQSINLLAPATGFAAATVNGSTIAKDGRYTDETTYNFYQGNIADITSRAGITTSYLWGYNNSLPIAKAVGTSHASLLAAYGAGLANIRSQPQVAGAMISTYVHSPLVGMASETDPQGRTLSYTYDALGRLLTARDYNGKILKRICYSFNGQQGACPGTPGPTQYTNDAMTASFTKQGCPAASTSYAVAAGKYSSYIDKATVNQQATAELNTNGQAAANAMPCPLGPGVYVRLEVEGSYIETNSYPGWDDYSQKSSVYIRMYSDAQCTQPLTLTEYLPLGYSTSVIIRNQGGMPVDSQDGSPWSTGIMAGESEQIIDNIIPMYSWETAYNDLDANGEPYYRVFSLMPYINCGGGATHYTIMPIKIWDNFPPDYGPMPGNSSPATCN